MTELEFEEILKNDIKMVEKAVIDFLPVCEYGQDEVVEAMKYSLSNGGKRLRPVFCMEFANCLGLQKEKALPFACAIEYIHTYSLIHDDLPCMDDDDYRRGKPSCHKKFGETTALLAGDALLTHAFKIATDSELSSEKIVKAVNLLSKLSGVEGMIGGQVLDLKYEKDNPNLRQLLSVHKLKTSALIELSCLLGCVAAGANEEQMKAASKFANDLGVAFQIKDDILDVIGDAEKLGKPIGSDASNDKTTYVSLVGLDKAQEDVEELTKSAISMLSNFENIDFLKTLSNKLVYREM